MTKKKWFMGLAAVGILGGGAFYLAPVMEESTIGKAESIKEAKFEKMEDVQIEILDTSAFGDKNVENWFNEKKDKGGEHLYYDNENTYVLVAGGDSAKETEIIWLDGVKSVGNKLVVGYEFKDGAEFGVSSKDKKPTLLVRAKGEFKEVNGMMVEKKPVKAPEPQVTETTLEENQDVDVLDGVEPVEEEASGTIDKSVKAKDSGETPKKEAADATGKTETAPAN